MDETAAPDSALALTGENLSTLTGASAGSDTQFEVFGQNATGSYLGTATVLGANGMKPGLALPAALPANSMYLVWPVNANGAGYPVAVNATDGWWIGPNAATRGDTVSVFGRNLAFWHRLARFARLYPARGPGGSLGERHGGESYKVDFTVPPVLRMGRIKSGFTTATAGTTAGAVRSH